MAPQSPSVRSEAPSVPSSAPQTTKPVAISTGQRNVLLPDVEIEGEVRFEDDLLVDGRIEGKIFSDGSLTIGETAKIKAEINCGSVVVHGKVQGNITVSDRVEIRAKAEVIGDIKAQALAMEAGAIFVGASAIGTPKGRLPKQEGGSSSGSSSAPQKDNAQGSGGNPKSGSNSPSGGGNQSGSGSGGGSGQSGSSGPKTSPKPMSAKS